MEQVEILVMALEYIERNITKKMKTKKVAAACFCSKSALEKLFRCLNHISVHDYIIRRKMACAGRQMHGNPKKQCWI